MQFGSVLPIQNILYLLIVLFFAVYWLFTFATIYHLTRFGIGTLPKKVASVFMLGSVLFFGGCLLFLFSLDGGLLVEKFKQFAENSSFLTK